MAKIAGLCRITGRVYIGSNTIHLPSFADYKPRPRVSDAAVEAASKVWLRLSNAWKVDPCADVELNFLPYEADPIEFSNKE